MSRTIHVEVDSVSQAGGRPRRFTLDADTYEIDRIEDRWRERNTDYFRVLTTDGKTYVLRYEPRQDRWTVRGGFDGDVLLARLGI